MRSSPSKLPRRWAWLAGVLSVVAVAAGLTVGSAPAYANTSDPVAIGVFRAGDMRVLHVSGDGTSNSSRIVASTYIPGTTGADVGRQRWKLERLPASEGFPDYAYRIRNVATNKCLDKSGSVTGNGAPIILYTCNNGSNQVWWTGITASASGTQWRNYNDYRCMDVRGGSTANNAEVISFDCGTGWNQFWKLRTGSFDCGYRTRDWTGMSQMCVRGSQNFTALISNWKNFPAQLAYRDPGSYPLSNVVRRYTRIVPINGQGTSSGTAVEVGWQAQRTSSSVATPVYSAYWIETLAIGQQVHAIPAVDEFNAPNGSAVADSRNHTYMLTGTGTAGQFDIYFDYNRVGTTGGQPGGRLRDSEAGLQVRYLDATGLADPVELRTQLMDENGIVRRPYYAETAVATPKQCNMPPDYADYGGGTGSNKPPWCLDATRITYTQPDWPLQTDVFTVRKPTTAAAAAQTAQRLRVQQPGHEGVDQSALAACLQTQASNCLDTVPGLRACVLARKDTCNTVTTTDKPTRQARPIGLAEAKTLAKAQLRTASANPRAARAVNAEVARTTTVGELRSQLSGFHPVNMPDTEKVHVLSGDDTVAAVDSAARGTYHGWTLVYRVQDGSLLFAVVGR
ncbi:RICIN domain-containing protein [Krasilnikovia sp. M28-CT-15]|uniref:RICIN domain-containing protein n=1 Tax=Krasilnikovia sp. M28-CT-15 TaxID=3373540 RepID=UPI0038776B95